MPIPPKGNFDLVFSHPDLEKDQTLATNSLPDAFRALADKLETLDLDKGFECDVLCGADSERSFLITFKPRETD